MIVCVQVLSSCDNSSRIREVELLESRIDFLYDEKISEFQFEITAYYDDIEMYKFFFDSLDTSLSIIRESIVDKEFSKDEKRYIYNFIFNQLVSRTGTRDYEICSILNIVGDDDLFEKKYYEIVDRLLDVINPYIFSRRGFFTSFDFWKIDDKFNYPGDTITYSVRLLNNLSINRQNYKLLDSEGMSIINPFLGTLKVYIPLEVEKGSYYPISFKIYDWLKKDTLDQEISILIN